MSYITQTDRKVNNKCMKTYDKDKPSVCFIYFDVNNLYRQEIVQYLSSGVFKWLRRNEILILDVNTIREDDIAVWVLKVDIGYPEYFHDQHDDYPPTI